MPRHRNRDGDFRSSKYGGGGGYDRKQSRFGGRNDNDRGNRPSKFGGGGGRGGRDRSSRFSRPNNDHRRNSIGNKPRYGGDNSERFDAGSERYGNGPNWRAASPRASNSSFDNKPYGGNQEPFGGNQDSFSGNQEPFDGNQDPFDGNQGPFDGNQGPFEGHQVPFAGNQPPFGGNQPPFGGNQPPFALNQTPFAGNQPLFGGNQPPFGENQLPFSGNQAPFGGNQAPFASNQGFFGGMQSPFGTNQGFFGNQTPFGGFGGSQGGYNDFVPDSEYVKCEVDMKCTKMLSQPAGRAFLNSHGLSLIMFENKTNPCYVMLKWQKGAQRISNVHFLRQKLEDWCAQNAPDSKNLVKKLPLRSVWLRKVPSQAGQEYLRSIGVEVLDMDLSGPAPNITISTDKSKTLVHKLINRWVNDDPNECEIKLELTTLWGQLLPKKEGREFLESLGFAIVEMQIVNRPFYVRLRGRAMAKAELCKKIEEWIRGDVSLGGKRAFSDSEDDDDFTYVDLTRAWAKALSKPEANAFLNSAGIEVLDIQTSNPPFYMKYRGQQPHDVVYNKIDRWVKSDPDNKMSKNAPQCRINVSPDNAQILSSPKGLAFIKNVLKLSVVQISIQKPHFVALKGKDLKNISYIGTVKHKLREFCKKNLREAKLSFVNRAAVGQPSFVNRTPVGQPGRPNKANKVYFRIPWETELIKPEGRAFLDSLRLNIVEFQAMKKPFYFRVTDCAFSTSVLVNKINKWIDDKNSDKSKQIPVNSKNSVTGKTGNSVTHTKAKKGRFFTITRSLAQRFSAWDGKFLLKKLNINHYELLHKEPPYRLYVYDKFISQRALSVLNSLGSNPEVDIDKMFLQDKKSIVREMYKICVGDEYMKLLEDESDLLEKLKMYCDSISLIKNSPGILIVRHWREKLFPVLSFYGSWCKHVKPKHKLEFESPLFYGKFTLNAGAVKKLRSEDGQRFIESLKDTTMFDLDAETPFFQNIHRLIGLCQTIDTFTTWLRHYNIKNQLPVHEDEEEEILLWSTRRIVKHENKTDVDKLKLGFDYNPKIVGALTSEAGRKFLESVDPDLSFQIVDVKNNLLFSSPNVHYLNLHFRIEDWYHLDGFPKTRRAIFSVLETSLTTVKELRQREPVDVLKEVASLETQINNSDVSPRVNLSGSGFFKRTKTFKIRLLNGMLLHVLKMHGDSPERDNNLKKLEHYVKFLQSAGAMTPVDFATVQEIAKVDKMAFPYEIDPSYKDFIESYAKEMAIDMNAIKESNADIILDQIGDVKEEEEEEEENETKSQNDVSNAEINTEKAPPVDENIETETQEEQVDSAEPEPEPEPEHEPEPEPEPEQEPESASETTPATINVSDIKTEPETEAESTQSAKESTNDKTADRSDAKVQSVKQKCETIVNFLKIMCKKHSLNDYVQELQEIDNDLQKSLTKANIERIYKIRNEIKECLKNKVD